VVATVAHFKVVVAVSKSETHICAWWCQCCKFL